MQIRMNPVLLRLQRLKNVASHVQFNASKQMLLGCNFRLDPLGDALVDEIPLIGKQKPKSFNLPFRP